MSTAPAVAQELAPSLTLVSDDMAVPGQHLVQRVIRQAVQVFRSTGSPTFAEGLASLRKLTQQLTANDVGLDPSWVRDSRPYHPSHGVPPMTYVRLFENGAICIGIFILKNGFTLPTHDHPEMYGMLKVLHGTLLMQSFTRVPATLGALAPLAAPADAADWDVRQTPIGLVYHTKKEPPCRLTPDDPPCVLTPEQSNIHQIRAVDGPVAFLDILSPPYDERTHVYHNFRELEPQRISQLTGGALNSDGWLLRVRHTRFNSDEKDYRGPPLNDID